MAVWPLLAFPRQKTTPTMSSRSGAPNRTAEAVLCTRPSGSLTHRPGMSVARRETASS
jgi:hypothetical protein